MRFLERELKTRRSATSCQNAYYDGPSWCLWALHTNLWTYTLSRQDGIMEDAAWINDQRRGWLSDWLVRHLRPAKWHRRYCIRRCQNRLDSASCVHWSLRSHRAFRPRWKGFYFRWAFEYILLFALWRAALLRFFMRKKHSEKETDTDTKTQNTLSLP